MGKMYKSGVLRVYLKSGAFSEHFIYLEDFWTDPELGVLVVEETHSHAYYGLSKIKSFTFKFN